MNGALQAGAFIKIIITEVFYKTDAIYLQHIYFCTELYRLYFFTSDNRAYIRFMQRYNPIRHFCLLAKVQLPLLLFYLIDNTKPAHLAEA